MAKLKKLVKTLDGVDEKYRELYVKTDEGFVLDEDESDMRAKLDEFRSSNRKYFGEIETLKAEVEKFKGIDPAKYQAAVAALEKLGEDEDAQLIKAGKVDQVIKKRMEALTQEYDRKEKAYVKRVTEQDTEIGKLRKSHVKSEIERQILGEVEKGRRVRPEARQDLIRKLQDDWSWEDDKLVPKDAHGVMRYNAKNGVDPQSKEDYAQSILQSSSFYFEPGQGAGAKGSTDNLPGGKVRVDTNDPMALGRTAAKGAKGEVEYVTS